MAGFQNKFGSRNAPAAATSNFQKSADNSDKVIITGLYEHTNKAGTPSKLVMKGKTNKEIVIPAGYDLKVFVQGGKSKNGKELPPYQLVAQKARPSTARA